jgi:SDR family mycofactocin-dependent oxidoreductase
MADADVGPLQGRVAVITGGARGQGRSHAVALARLGADVAVCDRCQDLDTVAYPLARPEDLAETVRLVEAEGRRCVSDEVDVRDLGATVGFVDGPAADLGPLGILVANAGVSTIGSITTMTDRDWSETVDTNLTGVFNAMRAVAPHLQRAGWGRIVAVSSMMGRSANPFIPAYVASKWGVIGLVKSVALELAAHGITVNAVAPGNISTPMIHNDALYRLMRPDLEHPTREDVAGPMTGLHEQPVPWLEPEEVTAAVVYLCSEGARHVTGTVLDVDAGASARFTA